MSANLGYYRFSSKKNQCYGPFGSYPISNANRELPALRLFQTWNNIEQDDAWCSKKKHLSLLWNECMLNVDKTFRDLKVWPDSFDSKKIKVIRIHQKCLKFFSFIPWISFSAITYRIDFELIQICIYFAEFSAHHTTFPKFILTFIANRNNKINIITKTA